MFLIMSVENLMVTVLLTIWCVMSVAGRPSMVQNGDVRSPPASQSRPFLTSPPCTNPIDMVIAVDTSGSMKSVLHQVIDDAETLSSDFSVSDNKVRMSIIDFSAVSNVHKALDSNNTNERVYQTLEEIRYRPQLGETWPELALDRASDIFVKATPRREDARKVMVLFTDGDMTGDEKEGVTSLVKNLKLHNTSVFVVEATNNHIRKEVISMMATSTNHVYTSIFDAYYNQKLLKDAICWGVTKASAPQTGGTYPIDYIQQPMVAHTSPPLDHSKEFTLSPLTLPTSAPVVSGNQVAKPALYPKPSVIINPPPVNKTHPTKLSEESILHIKNNSMPNDPIYAVSIDFNNKTGGYSGTAVDPLNVLPPIYKQNSSPSHVGNSKPMITESPAPECFLKADPGLCRAAIPRYFYNATSQICEQFKYGGCGGNANNFVNEEECIEKCHGVPQTGGKYPIDDIKEPKPVEMKVAQPIFTGVPQTGGKYPIDDIKEPKPVEMKVAQPIVTGIPQTGGKYPIDDIKEPKPVEMKVAQPIFIGNTMPRVSTKCLELKAYAMKNPAAFLPGCNETTGKFNPEQIDLVTGYHWCVDQDNGLEVYGTRSTLSEDLSCPKTKNTTRAPKTKCEFDLEDGMKIQKQVPDFNPLTCSAFDGLYEEIQSVYFLGTWCVDRYTGKEINGTRIPVGSKAKVMCPAKSLCQYEREKAIGYNYRNADDKINPIFVPDCQPNGKFNKIQWQIIDGSAWCVDEETGQEVFGTRTQGHQEPLPVCPGVSPRCMKPIELHVMDGSETGPLCDLFYYDVSTSSCKTGKGQYCGVSTQNEFQSLRECQRECESIIDPRCTYTTSPNQPETSQSDQPCYLYFTHYVYDSHDNVCRSTKRCGERNSHDFDLLQDCQNACERPKNVSSLGLIPTQTKSAADTSRMVGSTTTINAATNPIKSPKLLEPQPEPEALTPENGAYSVHKQTAEMTYSEPEVLPSPPEVDMYNPQNSCDEERDFATQRKMSQHFKYVFVPDCNPRGNYNKLQHGPNGERWCVDPTSGKLIKGTIQNAGQPDLDCDKVMASTTLNPEKPVGVVGRPPTPVAMPLASTPVNKSQQLSYGSDEHLIAGGYPVVTVGNRVTPAPVSNKTPVMLDKMAPLAQQNTLGANMGTPAPVINKTPAMLDSTTPKPQQIEYTIVKEPLKTPETTLSTATAESSTIEATPSPITTTSSPRQTQCPHQIGVNLKKLGCYRDTHEVPQSLPVKLMPYSNETKRAFEEGDKEKWASSIKQIVCECANLTASKGWFTFGVQNFGDCYSGPDEGRYHEDGSADADMCRNENLDICDTKDNTTCIGISKKDKFVPEKTDYANFVYTIITENHKEIVYIEYDRKKRHIHTKNDRKKRHASTKSDNSKHHMKARHIKNKRHIVSDGFSRIKQRKHLKLRDI